MFLLDTIVISELRRLDKVDRNVAAWTNALPAASFFKIRYLDIELGALLIARKDAAQGAVLRAWIDHQILARFEGRVLAVDTAVAQWRARLHVPDPRAERDALIAATALVYGLTVVTRNVADFKPTGVALINPWERQQAGNEGSR